MFIPISIKTSVLFRENKLLFTIYIFFVHIYATLQTSTLGRIARAEIVQIVFIRQILNLHFIH